MPLHGQFRATAHQPTFSCYPRDPSSSTSAMKRKSSSSLGASTGFATWNDVQRRESSFKGQNHPTIHYPSTIYIYILYILYIYTLLYVRNIEIERILFQRTPEELVQITSFTGDPSLTFWMLVCLFVCLFDCLFICLIYAFAKCFVDFLQV